MILKPVKFDERIPKIKCVLQLQPRSISQIAVHCCITCNKRKNVQEYKLDIALFHKIYFNNSVVLVERCSCWDLEMIPASFNSLSQRLMVECPTFNSSDRRLILGLQVLDSLFL